MTSEAWAVLVWFAARECGCVRVVSMRHANSLNWVQDPSAAVCELQQEGLVGDGKDTQYGLTDKGRELLQNGG